MSQFGKRRIALIHELQGFGMKAFGLISLDQDKNGPGFVFELLFQDVTKERRRLLRLVLLEKSPA